jgi:transposase
MANRLKMAIIDSILTLHQRHWSQRRIADELGLNRETVARYLKQAQQASKPANAPLGSEAMPAESKPANAPLGSDAMPGESKPAHAPLGSDAIPGESKPAHAPLGSSAGESAPSGLGRPSACEPYRPVIVVQLEQGLTAQRIYQDLVAEHGYAGSYWSVRRFVGRLEAQSEWPVRRLECGPGEEAQVDFGSGAPLVTADGKRQRTYVFRIVLSHSRKAYSEAVTRQTTEAFIRCLENAFVHFGGVTQRLVLDNLRAAVKQADWFDPELNPKVQAFAQHYGTVFLPTRPYTPRHKGKVERGVGYVQDNALKGRTFASLEEENRFLLDWEQTVADTRVHGTTRRQVGKVFREGERAALVPLPVERFPFFHESQRSVHRDGHVEVDKAYYSVPPEYLGRRVWVRWDSRLVRVFNARWQQIALHVKHEPGRFSTQGQHIAAEKISNIERGAAWLLGQVRRLGPQATRWAEGVIQVRGVEGIRVLQGLLSLAKRHRCEQLEHACELAHAHGSYRLRTVRQLIDRDVPQQQLAFLDDDPLIRPLSDYARFVHDTFQKGASS